MKLLIQKQTDTVPLNSLLLLDITLKRNYISLVSGCKFSSFNCSGNEKFSLQVITQFFECHFYESGCTSVVRTLTILVKTLREITKRFSRLATAYLCKSCRILFKCNPVFICGPVLFYSFTDCSWVFV